MQNKHNNNITNTGKTPSNSSKTALKSIVGWGGAIIIVFNYLLLSTEVFTATSVIFNVFQLVGGTLLAIRVWLDRNYSNFMLEVFFICIAIYAILKVWNLH